MMPVEAMKLGAVVYLVLSIILDTILIVLSVIAVSIESDGKDLLKLISTIAKLIMYVILLNLVLLV